MAVDDSEVHLWKWRYTDQLGKRRLFPCRLTEEVAKQTLPDPEKVQGSLEVRRSLGHTSDWLTQCSPGISGSAPGKR